MTCKDELLDVLDKMEFFNQRAGRELWFDKPKEIQEQDIADRYNDIQRLKDYINNSLDLPCKVGDVVYVITVAPNVKNRIILECEVTELQFENDKIGLHIFVRTNDGGMIPESYFGKTVFLTKEAAEQALKEMKGDGNQCD